VKYKRKGGIERMRVQRERGGGADHELMSGKLVRSKNI